MITSKHIRSPGHSSESARQHWHEHFWLPTVLVLLLLAAIYGGNAKAQEAVKSPEIYAAMKAGFPGNFEDIVAGKKVMVFADVVPVLVNKDGAKVEAKAAFDAVTYTDSNKQYAAIAYAMQGEDGSAYQIKDKSGKVVATAFVRSQAGSEGLLLTVFQDGDKIILDITTSSGTRAGGGGGGGGAGGGGGN